MVLLVGKETFRRWGLIEGIALWGCVLEGGAVRLQALTHS